MANKNIPDLTDSVSSFTGNELIEVYQGGKNKKSFISTLSSYFGSAFSSIKFAPQSTPPSHQEGLIYYDNTKKALTAYNNDSDLALNIGEELWTPIVINNTGSQINNGQVVYINGASGGYYSVALANAQEKNKSRRVYVATEDIPNSGTGRVTKFGSVGGLNTSAYTAGSAIYLGTIDGAFTSTPPDDGAYKIIIGIVKIQDASSGIILVDSSVSDYTVEINDTNGFPPDQRTATTISFTDATRTFTIAPTGSGFHFYELGEKYEKTTSESVIIDDTEGNHLIYYDSGTLTSIANPTSSQAQSIILNNCIVAYIQWSVSLATNIFVNDERHGISMSPQTHLYLHITQGAKFQEGLALSGIIIGNGSLNSHAQFGNTSGYIRDEDLVHTISSNASTVGYRCYYRSGAAGNWYYGTNSGYPFLVGATPLPRFNEWTGSTWQLTEVTSGNYVNVHIFASGDKPGKLHSFVGTSQYGSASLATSGQANELTSLLANLPLPEFVLIASVIIEGKISLTNSMNARVVQNSNGSDYTDWRTSRLTAGTSPANHENLAGLELAGDGITYGHIDDQSQTIYGGKEFDEKATFLSGIGITALTGAYTDNMLVIDSGGDVKKVTHFKTTSTASSSTPAPTGDARENEYYLTALAAGATFAAPSGTPANGNTLLVRIKDDGTARSLAWNAIYRAVAIALPTTTVLSKTMYLGFIYNSADSKWDLVSLVNEI